MTSNALEAFEALQALKLGHSANILIHYKFRGVTSPVLCRFSNDFAESLPQTAK